MVCFGAVLVEPALNRTFYGRLRPISERWIPEALAVSGFTRAQMEAFDNPAQVMEAFRAWLEANAHGRPRFVADNNGFDWQFINYYFHRFLGGNPFGHSSMNLSSFYQGVVRDTGKSFKHLRQTAHTHHPVDDARGNAEALLEILRQHDIRINL